MPGPPPGRQPSQRHEIGRSDERREAGTSTGGEPRHEREQQDRGDHHREHHQHDATTPGRTEGELDDDEGGDGERGPRIERDEHRKRDPHTRHEPPSSVGRLGTAERRLDPLERGWEHGERDEQIETPLGEAPQHDAGQQVRGGGDDGRPGPAGEA